MKILKKNFYFFYNILIFLILYLLVFFPQIYLMYNEFYKFIDFKKIDDNAGYGNIFGGLIYQVMMYFAWAVYYDFTPRGFFSFKDYYFSIFYYFGIFFLYSAAFVGAISSYKNKKKNYH